MKQAAHSQCKSDIEDALDNIEWDGLDPKPNSKQVREAVKRLLKQLEDCKREYEALHKLDCAHAHELMRGAPDLDVHIATYKEWLSERPGQPRRSAAKQMCAVKEARTLVLKYCKSEKDHSTTRGNAWHKLSAILAGDDQLDLFNHMRKTLSGAKIVPPKV
ncbi:MAG: hypothetical protein WDN48_14200 [Pseudolabrys sp.]